MDVSETSCSSSEEFVFGLLSFSIESSAKTILGYNDNFIETINSKYANPSRAFVGYVSGFEFPRWGIVIKGEFVIVEFYIFDYYNYNIGENYTCRYISKDMHSPCGLVLSSVSRCLMKPSHSFLIYYIKIEYCMLIVSYATTYLPTL